MPTTNKHLLRQPPYRFNYKEWYADTECMPGWKRREACADMCISDMYFLLRYGCAFPPHLIDHPFTVARCNEVSDMMADPEGLHNTMTMGFRFSYKSTCLDYGALLARILKYPEDAFCAFSFNKTVADRHVRPIKEELETNIRLKDWFGPKGKDILYPEPHRQSSQWSVEGGCTINRCGNRDEPTIMGSGLVSGLPIGLHFNGGCFDDVVTRDSVKTAHSIKDTTEAYRNALSLLVRPNSSVRREIWILGTFYAFNDTYTAIIKDGVYQLVKIPWINRSNEVMYDTPPGEYFLHTIEEAEELRKQFGRYEVATQFDLEPVSAEDRSFDWFIIQENMYNPAELNMHNMRTYLMADLATKEKEKRGHRHDQTVLLVLGKDNFGNEYLLDGVVDRMSRPDSVKAAFDLTEEWDICHWSWEEVAAQEDEYWIRREMGRLGVNFKFESYKPKGNKFDRIEGAILPVLESGQLKLPTHIGYRPTEGPVLNIVDMIRMQLEEFRAGEDDIIDALAQRTALPAFGRSKKSKMREDPLEKPYHRDSVGAGGIKGKYL